MTTTRRLAAILAADVVGYSRLMGSDEEGTLAALNAVRRELVDPKLAEYGGRLVKTTGDGLLVEFPSVVQAMRCAVEMQQAMAERNRPVSESRRMHFRMGITLGDIIVEGNDIFGDGVNIAARLEQLSSPGGISISSRVYEDVRDRLAIGFQDGGEQQLKNIARPVRVWHWLTGGANRLPTDPATDFDWDKQQIKYCRTPDGVRLAYSVIGEGPPLVKAGGFLSHLQHETPVWGPGFLRLSNGRSFIRYDARGNGLSDWDVTDLSQESWVTDLETVVDTLGLKRFGLIGFSQGCATSIAYAVRHPEKVSHLILYGGFARGGLESGDNDKRESTLAQATLMRMGWSSSNSAYRQIYATRMLPDMTKKQAEDFDRLLRETSSGDVAARYLVAAAEIDVSTLLAQVRVPTLVMHMRDDAVVPFEAGKTMAEGIPGARFIGISGRSHVPLPGDPASDRGFEEIDLFLNQQFGRPLGAKGSGEMSESASPLPLPDKPSIAVLPFQNMSGDPEQEYFADGIVEDIVTALSRFKSLFVIARNSSFTYKGKAVDIKQVGRDLGVRYVLEGSVRKAGGRVRITGQLIEAATNQHLWADRFDGPLDDVFELQDSVTASVVGIIAPHIVRSEVEKNVRKPTEDLRAYDYYLRGIASVDDWTPTGSEACLQMFGRAIELDPNFSGAHVRLAMCYQNRQVQGWMADPAKETAEAFRLTRRALDTAKDDAFVLSASGFLMGSFFGDIDTGILLMERALPLNANDADAWRWSGWLRVYKGDQDVAIEQFQMAQRLNPFDPYIFATFAGRALALFLIDRREEARMWAERALADNANYLPSQVIMSAIYASLGEMDAAREITKRLQNTNPARKIANVRLIGFLQNLDQREKLTQALRLAGTPE